MSTSITAHRYHDISCGHTVTGHEGKCRHLHGHNYRFHFICAASQLDEVGRVIDFSAIKEKLCMFLETQFDHKFLIWQEDPRAFELQAIDPTIVIVPFNPTAENLARTMLEVYGPKLLEGTGVVLQAVKVEETRKCSAVAAASVAVATAASEANFVGTVENIKAGGND